MKQLTEMQSHQSIDTDDNYNKKKPYSAESRYNFTHTSKNNEIFNTTCGIKNINSNLAKTVLDQNNKTNLLNTNFMKNAISVSDNQSRIESNYLSQDKKILLSK